MHNYYPDTSKDDMVVGVSCVVQDITEPRQAEEALRESEAMLKQAVQIAVLGHWRADEVGREFLSVSEEFARILGYTADEFMKLYPSLDQEMEPVHPEDRAKVTEAYEKGGEQTIEYRIVRPDGSVRLVREIFRDILDESGRPWQSIGTLQDITERMH